MILCNLFCIMFYFWQLKLYIQRICYLIWIFGFYELYIFTVDELYCAIYFFADVDLFSNRVNSFPGVKTCFCVDLFSCRIDSSPSLIDLFQILSFCSFYLKKIANSFKIRNYWKKLYFIEKIIFYLQAKQKIIRKKILLTCKM